MDLRACDADWVFPGGELHLSVVCCVLARLLVFVTRLLVISYSLVLCVLACVFSTPDASLDQWDCRKTTAESFFTVKR